MAETFPVLSFGVVGFSVFYSLPMGPCSPRGSRDLLENGGCATKGCEWPAWPTHHLFKSYFVAKSFKICSIHTRFGRVLKGRMIPEGLCSWAGSSDWTLSPLRAGPPWLVFPVSALTQLKRLRHPLPTFEPWPGLPWETALPWLHTHLAHCAAAVLTAWSCALVFKQT